MWKDSTVRKVRHAPKAERGWLLLLIWSGVPLLIAVISGVLGFLIGDGSPAMTGIAQFVFYIAVFGFVAMVGTGLYAKYRSG
jgi:uncharacterized membrane protein YtjA (UPF0391 family)